MSKSDPDSASLSHVVVIVVAAAVVVVVVVFVVVFVLVARLSHEFVCCSLNEIAFMLYVLCLCCCRCYLFVCVADTHTSD
jgi:hypothetical protein